MPNETHGEDVVARVKEIVIEELGRDWVGLWLVCQLCLKRTCESEEEAIRCALAVCEELFRGGLAVAGQFDLSGFHVWEGGVDQWMARIVAELAELGRMPDLAEIMWLAEPTPESEAV